MIRDRAMNNQESNKKKNLKQSTRFSQTLLDSNFMWTGKVYMGMSQTNMSVVFDTGSDWMVIQGSTCINCEGQVFNADGSGTKTNTTL
jgi:hypothetical protein